MKLALFSVVLVLFFATGVITLMGIVQRVQIERKYLNALFSALILELIAAVMFLFTDTDFFTQPTVEELVLQDVAEFMIQHPNAYVPELLTKGLQFDAEQHRLSLRQSEDEQAERDNAQLQAQVMQLQAQLVQRNDQLKWLNDELEVRKGSMVRLAKLERQFLVKMADLNSKIGEWGTSVNFQWQPEEKREIALMLQEAFKEIGFMKELELPNDDPMLAMDILIRYQTERKFKEVGFLTHQTIAFIVQDYLKSSI